MCLNIARKRCLPLLIYDEAQNGAKMSECCRSLWISVLSGPDLTKSEFVSPEVGQRRCDVLCGTVLHSLK